MSTLSTSSRRAFLTGGAIAAAPLAVAVPAAALAEGEHRARAQRLQDEAEIRALHQAWLRKVATSSDASVLFADAKAARLPKSVRGIAADHAGEADRIEVTADGLRASGRFATLVDLETELPRDTTLAQMAHAQGQGMVRTSERRTLHASYVKAEGGWAIARLEFRAA
jgi:hypothetical protein